MSEAWDVDILTTCALDYTTWKNHYPEGHTHVGGVHVQRFPVDRPRNVRTFNRLSHRIRFDIEAATEADEEEWMRAQGPYSSALINHVEAHQSRYNAFFFFGYLYATTYYALPIVESKAYLVPLAHDEWTIHLKMWEDFFQRPKAIVFNTPEERAFLERRFPDHDLNGCIAGIGVEFPAATDPVRFVERFGIGEPFLLYVGRIEASKGCGRLLDDFAYHRARGGSVGRLVMIGQLAMEAPVGEGVSYLGSVDEITKWDAIAACAILVMPSEYESLSIAVLEAWAAGRPVLVNARSSVLVGQCRRAQGGVWYGNAEEFSASIDVLAGGLGVQLGLQGRKYVSGNYTWGDVEATYRALLEP